MYVASDPRSRLNSSETEAPAPLQSAANCARFYEEESHTTSEALKTWYTRGQNFVVAYSEAKAGAVFARAVQPDEFMVLLPDPASRARLLWNGETSILEGHSVTFVPPGESRISMERDGTIVQFFTTASDDLVATCPPGYDNDPNVPALVPWPEPNGGWKPRCYSMDVPPEKGRFGRILTSTNFMVNYIYPRTGPRDRSAMSPHSHVDFQQCSLVLEGSYIHHMRWPWGNNADLWRDDEHAICDAPSVMVIPAQVVHTSEAVGLATNFMIDVFCPPRRDFLRQPGWVLNADDYPEPQDP
ncbi:hypothetical protein [Pelagibacterium limicola]|uniref:hypothetical protein n=1 Tax=Pelagibacterium limicola TaxID=2791022 RepID=UPI0018AF6834|nr:hypothetical protein [Pelagibacterium limicola]